jgi:uncharacterized membrane protein YkvA (DUF1232 family)
MGSVSVTGRAPGRLRRLLGLGGVARLCWRCFRDGRVPLWPKAVPVLAVAYVLLPFDLLPDVMPFVGQVDDLAMLSLAAWIFLACCPAAVVAEHRRAIGDRRGRRWMFTSPSPARHRARG